jgi:hypothetical protein
VGKIPEYWGSGMRWKDRCWVKLGEFAICANDIDEIVPKSPTHRFILAVL